MGPAGMTDGFFSAPGESSNYESGYRPKIIVLGNEKGGSGKSTTAMHLIVALLKHGLSVGCIDLDARQGTLSRMLENRESFMSQKGLRLAMPSRERLFRSESEIRSESYREEEAHFQAALERLWLTDYLVIDTPGSDTYLSRLAHTHADILITPMNDSFLDLDLLARIDPEAKKVMGPSVYSQMVWEQRQLRAKAGGRPIDWVILRNRLSHIDARNKRDIERLLVSLSKRIGFRMVPGFGERVIFRELFLKGLTLLDLREEGVDQKMTMSHVAARQEVRVLLEALNLGKLQEEIDRSVSQEAGTEAMIALPL
ncbi:MAG: division plane positioning ATPase MipZ [Kiloniellales bacterium]|nr:division plane positioning ATPase MipZ [Kiloniellales bacterium]